MFRISIAMISCLVLMTTACGEEKSDEKNVGSNSEESMAGRRHKRLPKPAPVPNDTKDCLYEAREEGQEIIKDCGRPPRD